MMQRVLVALLVTAALLGALVWVVRKTSGERRSDSTLAADNAGARGDGSPSRATQRTQAMQQLAQIAETSHGLMPEGFDRLYVSMPLDSLQRIRTSVRQEHGALAQRDDTQQVWAEDDPGGARVIYLVAPRSQLVTQVQFMSRLQHTEELGPHFRALQDRYGQPTGVWDCPETPTTSPMRRFTWRREGSSLMEAVLIYGSTIAITLIIAATEDIGAALRRGGCQPVQGNEALARFPVARELRGTQETFVRELHRDAAP